MGKKVNEQELEKLQIENYAKEIINNLGRRYATEPLDDIEDRGPTYRGEYSGYGIEISAIYPDNSYTDFSYLSIESTFRTVYSTGNTFIKGTWQEVLKTLVEKIPIFLEERKENEKIIKHARNLYENYIKPIHKNGLKINDSLCFSAYQEYDPYPGYGDSTTYHNTVKKDGKIVLDVINRIFSFSIYDYIPGSWEKEVIAFYQSYTQHETDTEKEYALEQLHKLRKK